ncbi:MULTISPECIES: GNAT family N-acetyltransferase [unclassified Pseudomonas]|uniref:GNAT family N-acetyltransferase n=1 Tax=unclassified Pseudomonas TaxID=196821 RepID=UPI0008E8169B|nr:MULTISPECIES: GNAT family N-acetyltransferase [unclassified Pseudomonas]PMV25331.1 GNAT family N-acetyltransferase [Pseudomonas sp. FW305-3-2-15-C-TSA2]PMV29053.1 GNAT family N-acetyltransferase [Pseudomonas sp. DP16D-L5]PMV39048.1 GNAT family N-acetyltransferase [Pseudomonas sp. FW305-3-2-15-A-LB2]PMV44502.1 GNAT family N-acetyltransferase [Pseudomonas sp. FW305-3-2-15-C-R2A1]PMV51360.1 GNAT family N-acetyltransferase [Pseudomonas sp. FW305-3-2-15-C-LB1]
MHTPEPPIVIQRFTEAHLEGVAALYNEPAVCRQVLQMPFQSVEMWRKRLVMDNERRLQLVALHGGEVVGQLGLEQYLRVRQAHVGSFGMGVATAWQGKGVGSRLLTAALDVADNWMNLHRVELTVYADNEAAQRLYRKFGFAVEGVLRDYALRDGQFVDTVSMARLRQSV